MSHNKTSDISLERDGFKSQKPIIAAVLTLATAVGLVSTYSIDQHVLQLAYAQEDKEFVKGEETSNE